MKATIKIEAIGDDQYQYMRFWTSNLNGMMPGLGDLIGAPKANYWVAMIVGHDNKYGYRRQFLKAKKDYSRSNSKGSRGVYLWYLLESGYVYEVCSPIAWCRFERYFCTVTDDGEIIRIEKDYVEQWINDHLASALMKPPCNA